MAALWVFLAVYFLIIFIVGVVVYVFNALGLVAIAKHRNIPNAALAWLPVFGTAYVTGAISDYQTQQEKGTDQKLRFWLVILLIVLCILNVVMMVQMFQMDYSNPYSANDPVFIAVLLLMLAIGLPFTVFWYSAHYKLFKSCQPNNSTLFLVLSILFGLAPFLIFAVRHYVDGYKVTS